MILKLKKPILIAEIGINHGGDLDVAAVQALLAAAPATQAHAAAPVAVAAPAEAPKEEAKEPEKKDAEPAVEADKKDDKSAEAAAVAYNKGDFEQFGKIMGDIA